MLQPGQKFRGGVRFDPFIASFGEEVTLTSLSDGSVRTVMVVIESVIQADGPGRSQAKEYKAYTILSDVSQGDTVLYNGISYPVNNVRFEDGWYEFHFGRNKPA